MQTADIAFCSCSARRIRNTLIDWSIQRVEQSKKYHVAVSPNTQVEWKLKGKHQKTNSTIVFNLVLPHSRPKIFLFRAIWMDALDPKISYEVSLSSNCIHLMILIPGQIWGMCVLHLFRNKSEFSWFRFNIF